MFFIAWESICANYKQIMGEIIRLSPSEHGFTDYHYGDIRNGE